MDEFVEKLVYDTVNTDGAAYELYRGIERVVENEVIAIEGGQISAADTACHLQKVRSAVCLSAWLQLMPCLGWPYLTVGIWFT